jgi:hypothetical protein
LLELGAVERYVGTLGCRLDVVAQHIDGEAVFLAVQPMMRALIPALGYAAAR